MEKSKKKVNCNDFYAFFECLYCFFFSLVLGATVRAGVYLNVNIHLKVEKLPFPVESFKVWSLPEYEIDSS